LTVEYGPQLELCLTLKSNGNRNCKQRVSAFTGSNLDMILRANNIDMLLLTGILTQGVVLSTLCHAADMDYRTVVVADGCSDKDPEVQRLLMEKIFPFQAMVTTVEECIDAIA
jgi:nicotinamidase-related amidase